ncbi:hypothetical protein ABZS68_42405 [Streptomyces sp. NPDC005571]|uniref:hypothetical protein n=1 Tax=Streptomyces sp. NPDC005571 TaxID=3156888 RepID=UPI0033BCA7F9
MADCEEKQGRTAGEHAAVYALDRQADNDSRLPKLTASNSLSELRERWRDLAIQAFGARVVHG